MRDRSNAALEFMGVLILSFGFATPIMAAEAVDLSDKVKWTCEGDTKVSLDQ